MRWCWIAGYEGFYKISDYGKVLSVRFRSKFLRPGLAGLGYPFVTLCRAADDHKMHYVHALVAAAFIGPRPIGKEVNHKDKIKTNNHFSNLEYVTPSENQFHASADGSRSGENNPCAKLLDVERRAAIVLTQFFGVNEVARSFRLTPKYLSRIAACDRRRWGMEHRRQRLGVAELVRDLRSSGATQREVAKKLKISRHTIRLLEMK